MGTTQITIFIFLLVIQLIALYIMLDNAAEKDNGLLVGFSIIFFASSLLVFLLLYRGTQLNNEHIKQESICTQYEEIEEPVYRLK